MSGDESRAWMERAADSFPTGQDIGSGADESGLGRETDPAEMAAAEVAHIVDWLCAHEVTYQINGGWGIDGLVGRQTRPHRDLDVFVDAAREADLVSWLRARGYVITEDWSPARVELTGEQGRVDVHPMAIDASGDGTQQGLDGEVYLHAARDRVLGQIDGCPAVVANAQRARDLRRGYPARAVDLHDLALLDGL